MWENVLYLYFIVYFFFLALDSENYVGDDDLTVDPLSRPRLWCKAFLFEMRWSDCVPGPADIPVVGQRTQ